ncbi:MAG: transcriptional regulator, MarR family [Paenibacillus sp.]|nr:transcriptional regulator, MarR family [Paenibacillus sp.]
MPETNNQLLNISSSFRRLLRRASHEWNKRMGDTFSYTQFRLLCRLYMNGSQKAADLADSVGVTSGAVTGLADKLIEKRLIERQRSEEDRRVVYLHLTELGATTVANLLEKQKETISSLFQGLSSEDIGHLERIFALMLDRMDQSETKE